MGSLFIKKIRKRVLHLAWLALLTVVTTPVCLALNTTIDFENNKINGQGGNISGTVTGDTYNITIKNPVTNTLYFSNHANVDSTVNVISDGTGSATPGEDVTLPQILMNAVYGVQKISLNLEDTNNQGKVVVTNLGSAASYGYAFFTNGLDISLSDKGYGSSAGIVDFSTGMSSSTTTSNITLKFHHENAATGVAQVTGNVNLNNSKILTAGITVDGDMTGYSIIGGTYNGSAGVDTFTYNGSATITGAVDLRGGDNIIILGNGKTATMSGGLKATGGNIEIQGGTATETLATTIDFSDDNAHTLGFTTNDDITLSGGITGGANIETLNFTNTATVSGTVNLGTGNDVLTIGNTKTATLSSALNVTGSDAAAATLAVSGGGNFTVSGTTTISGTSTNAGELQLDSTAANTLDAVVLSGTAASKAILDVNAGTGNTASSLTVSAGKYGTLDVATDQTTFETDSTEVKSGGTLQVIVANTDEDVDLGTMTLLGGIFDVSDTNRAATVKLDSLTINNGNVTIKGSGSTAADIIKIASGTVDNQSTLIYDSTAVRFVNSAGDAITLTGKTIDLGGAAENPDYTSSDTQTISNNGKVTDLGLNDNTKTRTAEVANNSTVVATSTQTVDTNNVLKIDYGSTYIQSTGTLSAANGSVILNGELNISAGASTVGTISTEGTTGTITGNNVTVNTLDINEGQTVNIAGTITLNSSNTVSGAVALAGEDKDTSGIIDIDGASSTFTTFNVSSDKYGVIKDTGAGSADALTVKGGTISGHLLLDSNADLIVDSGTLKISQDTLQMADGSSLSISTTGSLSTVSTTGDMNDGHVKVDATNGNVTATIRNQSTVTSNTIGWLDVDGGDTGAPETAIVNINNRNAADTADATATSYLKITKADITAGSNAGDTATVNITSSTSSMDVQITELNISGGAAGKLALSGLADTDITTANFSGTAGIIDNAVAGTAGTESTIMNVTTMNVDGSSASATGTLDSSANAAITELTTINLSGNGANNGKLDITNSGGASHTVTVSTLNLNGSAAVDDAEFVNTSGAVTLSDIQVAATKYGRIDNAGGTTAFRNATVNGTLDIDNAFTIGDGSSAYSFNVGSAGVLDAGDTAGNSYNTTVAANAVLNVSAGGAVKINNAANYVDVTTAGSKIILDFGTDADPAVAGTADAGTYATIQTGTIKDAGTATVSTGDVMTNVYAINGVAGLNYANVFGAAVIDTDAGGVIYGAGDLLATNDPYRSYTIDATTTGVDIAVNNSGINSTVSRNGGTPEGASAARYLVTNQGTLNTEGQEFVQRLTALTGADFARGADETAGVEATTQTSQTALTGVQESVGAVRNQMTTFRTGSLANGMASSFGSNGATAALNEMADAETLADAYESSSGEGYTAAAEETYRKVQVWANGYGGWGEQGTDNDMTGYDFYNVGVMGGLDYAFARELRVGALFGYTYNNTDIYRNRGESTDNVLRFGAYSSFNWNNFFADLTPTMGVHMIESKRNLITNGTTAKGERTGIDFNISGTVGYTFVLPAEFMLTPSYSLGYTMFYDPSYTETGAGAGNLYVDSFTSNSLVQDLGAKAGKLFCISDTLSILPEAWGGWEVEYLNTGGDRNSVTAAVLGSQSYSTSMNSMATHRAYWGAGVTALVNDNISVFGRYDQKIWDKGYNIGFTAGVKVGF